MGEVVMAYKSEHGENDLRLPAESQDLCCAPSREISPRPGGLEKFPSGAMETNRPAQTMVQIDDGTFLMGTDNRKGYPADGEGPVRRVDVASFLVSTETVTNSEFARFVEATGYETEAEKFGWSFVFHLFVSEETKRAVKQAVGGANWWWKVEGADWRHPEGPDSNVDERQFHPAIHVSWNDAIAYCNWTDARLPTEAEWEYMARGGLEQKLYPWGDDLTPNEQFLCNIWQGRFPDLNTAMDGYVGTAPARSFKPNGFGIYNVAGNVWEWCSDWFSTNFHVNGPHKNPQGAATGQAKVVRGGSYLCHYSYCNRYRVAARTANTPDSSTGNMGFRIVRNAKLAS